MGGFVSCRRETTWLEGFCAITAHMAKNLKLHATLYFLISRAEYLVLIGRLQEIVYISQWRLCGKDLTKVSRLWFGEREYFEPTGAWRDVLRRNRILACAVSLCSQHRPSSYQVVSDSSLESKKSQLAGYVKSSVLQSCWKLSYEKFLARKSSFIRAQSSLDNHHLKIHSNSG